MVVPGWFGGGGLHPGCPWCRPPCPVAAKRGVVGPLGRPGPRSHVLRGFWRFAGSVVGKPPPMGGRCRGRRGAALARDRVRVREAIPLQAATGATLTAQLLHDTPKIRGMPLYHLRKASSVLAAHYNLSKPRDMQHI